MFLIVSFSSTGNKVAVSLATTALFFNSSSTDYASVSLTMVSMAPIIGLPLALDRERLGWAVR